MDALSASAENWQVAVSEHKARKPVLEKSVIIRYRLIFASTLGFIARRDEQTGSTPGRTVCRQAIAGNGQGTN